MDVNSLHRSARHRIRPDVAWDAKIQKLFFRGSAYCPSLGPNGVSVVCVNVCVMCVRVRVHACVGMGACGQCLVEGLALRAHFNANYMG